MSSKRTKPLTSTSVSNPIAKAEEHAPVTGADLEELRQIIAAATSELGQQKPKKTKEPLSADDIVHEHKKDLEIHRSRLAVAAALASCCCRYCP